MFVAVQLKKKFRIFIDASEQNQQRLAKLLGLWNKFNYFSSDTMTKLSDPEKALTDYQVSNVKQRRC